MMMSLVERFRQIDTSDLPDVHSLADIRLKLFWVLAVAKRDTLLEFMKASEISDILRDSVGIHVSRQRVTAALENEKNTVSKGKKKGKRYFKLMRAGEDELVSSTVAPIFIDPTKAFSATRKLEEIIGTLSGDLEYCDAYVDRRTLDFLSNCKGAQSIKLLTENIHGSAAFKADLSAFQKEHGNILEVRTIGQGHLHDRYIVHGTGMLLIGASLKDLGKKQSFVVSLGGDISKAVSVAFKKNWGTAAKLS
jgi:hypothetical protein